MSAVETPIKSPEKMDNRDEKDISSEEVMLHLLQQVFKFKDDKVDLVIRWMEYNGLDDLDHIFQALCHDPSYLDSMKTYLDSEGKQCTLNPGITCKLSLIVKWANDFTQENKMSVPKVAIMNLTSEEFDLWRISSPSLVPIGSPRPAVSPLMSPVSSSGISVSSQQALTNFQKAIKRDPSSYETFKDE